MSTNTDPFISRIILASASPRRKTIFENAGFRIEIADPGDAEDAITSAASPAQLAIDKARAKAQIIAAGIGTNIPALVIGADTLVAAGNKVIGKPVDRSDATAILSGLSGTRHCVISGVCAIFAAGPGVSFPPLEFAESTWVTMRRMTAEEIADYVNSGQSDGKAGAYAIQENGDKFVEKLEGSFLNVVGFPLERFQLELPAAIKNWKELKQAIDHKGS